ncbi:hypothetical protein [Legionella oakridgensis]|uniref:Uncharacterized protein n=2 Tax=Legionella oakridgensis TaxID=29423 RepID=W0BCX7_9GAMM|nr:hypothetical protein [Legionella oakridgensis]AHE67725.1 hypothetical protein Loa_02183 [Legionella oakridgensis ATCC 33761 = DSM 21215]KTD36944.1 hypothetical protein Loak_2080 [Legionella oakridgensis]STY20747.1 Uncharacterised protein [Legionella longbeachae]
MALLAGTAFAEGDSAEARPATTIIMLETDSGTTIKAVVPKEEADKLNNVKPGEQVKLYNQELREPEEEDEDIEME